MRIKSVRARKILNSKDQPTIEVIVNGKYYAAAPSGTSKGEYEARDYFKNLDYAIQYINSKLDKTITGININEFKDLEKVERLMEGSGANPIIATEFAILKAVSDNKIWKFLNPKANKLPMLLGNCVGGGAHIKGRAPDIQEFLILPKTKSPKEGKFLNLYVHGAIKKKLGKCKKTFENAWAPNMSNIEILELLRNLVQETEEKFGIKIDRGLDVASNSFYDKGYYHYYNYSEKIKTMRLDPEGQLKFMKSIITDYELKYIEDPFEQNDFERFGKLSGTLVCGDDLICTNLERLKKAINKINAVIVKPNQIGSLIKTKELIDFAKTNDITPVISHRSGETYDNTIAHLAVGWSIPIIKTGITGEERLSKINELIKIEEEIK